MRVLYFLLLFILIGCSSQKNTTSTNATANTKIKEYDPNTIEVTQPEVPLSDYLKRFAGVSVRGSGRDAVILIRSGGNSLTSGTEPMFLINGTQFNGDFSDLSQTISVNDIKSVTVYKNASDTAFFGVRGANGVIDIKLK